MSRSETVAHTAAVSLGSADAAGVEESPILPPDSVVNRALVVVVAIMCFLASLTLGAVVMVRTVATEWQSQVTRELTVQVRAVSGRDIEADVARATDILRGAPGVAQARAFSRQESASLLEPWLGPGASYDTLPMPRMIVITTAAGAGPDVSQLRRNLTSAVPSASLDDHRGWTDRMRDITRAVTFGGITVLGLTLFATVLLVGFATEGAMATNRQIVEVLHFVGARNAFIAGQFQRHFLWLGMRGGLWGTGAGLTVFAGLALLHWFKGADLPAWVPPLTLRPEGYAGILGLTVLIASVVAITSRRTVHRILDGLD